MRPLFLLGVVALSACTPLDRTDGPREARPFEAADLDPSVLRFVTWNINTVGNPGDDEYNAMMDVVGRLQPDILALNEIEDDEDAWATEVFAEAAGYDHVLIADHVGFGDDRNAILSRYPITGFGVQLSDDPGEEHFMGWDSPSLSDDADAMDISRAIMAGTVHAPGGDIGVVSLHWKSGGTGNATEFRRAIETVRSLQAVDDFGDVDHVILSGDLNVDVNDRAPVPETFFEQPTGFPARFSLGDDLQAMLDDGGILNHPHAMLEDYGLVMHGAQQVDGTFGTRPASGRVLDYVYTDSAMVQLGSEVYNSVFDSADGGILKAGEPLDTFACPETSDHLPVVVDFDMGGEVGPTVLELTDLREGDLTITELLANPANCSDSVGEWIEITNDSGFAIQLDGLVVSDASGNEGVLGENLLDIGGRAVLARSASACDVAVDDVFGPDVSLNNAGDTLSLLAEGRTIDELTYPADAGVDGLSWRLDDEGAWCSGSASAGAENAPCDGSDPDPQPDPDPDPQPGVLTIADLVPGDVQVVELMVNPDVCSDSDGEWIEIVNASGSDVDLAGLQVRDATGNGGSIQGLTLAAGGRAVVSRSSSACGVSAASSYGSSVSLNNSGDDVVLVAGSTTIDSVTYPSAAGAAGMAWSMDVNGEWCSTASTAGAANPLCD